jgi:hypothetical protein
VLRLQRAGERDLDYLGLLNAKNNHNSKLLALLKKQGEYNELESTEVFSEYAYQVTNKLKREKRIIFATEMTLYCLSRNRLRLIARMPLNSLTQINLLKGSTALMQLTPTTKVTLTIETLKRTELLLFIMR